MFERYTVSYLLTGYCLSHFIMAYSGKKKFVFGETQPSVSNVVLEETKNPEKPTGGRRSIQQQLHHHSIFVAAKKPGGFAVHSEFVANDSLDPAGKFLSCRNLDFSYRSLHSLHASLYSNYDNKRKLA